MESQLEHMLFPNKIQGFFFANISKSRCLVFCLSSSCPHTFLLNLAVKGMWKQSQFCFPFAKQLRDPETWIAYELDVIFQNLNTYRHTPHKSEKPMRSFGLYTQTNTAAAIGRDDTAEILCCSHCIPQKRWVSACQKEK